MKKSAPSLNWVGVWHLLTAALGQTLEQDLAKELRARLWIAEKGLASRNGSAPAHYTSSREVFNTEAIAAVSRFQLSVSTRSRLRPVAVSW